jgi:hypothetical protein
MWQKLMQKNPNIVSKLISELSVSTMVEIHSKVNSTTIEVDN